MWVEYAIELGAQMTATLWLNQSTALLENARQHGARLMQQLIDDFRCVFHHLGGFAHREVIYITEHEGDVFSERQGLHHAREAKIDVLPHFIACAGCLP